MTGSPPPRRIHRRLHVLVVEHSALMRRYIGQCLEGAGHVVRLARDGREALRAVTANKPDVVILGVDLPLMDGLTCLSRLMVEAPVPVVMVSLLAERAATLTAEALKLGAVDFIPKPQRGLSHTAPEFKEALVARIQRAARMTVRRRLPRTAARGLDSHPHAPRSLRAAGRGMAGRELDTNPLRPVLERGTGSLLAVRESPSRPQRAVRERGPRPLRLKERVGRRVTPVRPEVAPAAMAWGPPVRSVDLVVVGVSTGGPRTLEAILCDLPESFAAPILVAQHMPANFTGIFAARLARLCAMDVVEVAGSEVLLPGTVYIARGGHDILVRSNHGRLVAASVASDPGRSWHPSVGRMVASALEVVPAKRLLGVQLTGMGDDGAEEMALLKTRGGRTIAQSEESCAVYGMPRALVLRKGASAVLSQDKIGPRMLAWM